jgi:hypothetical protein
LPIAQAPASGRVAIGGRAVEGEDGVATAPFSGRLCIWFKAVVQEYMPLDEGPDPWCALVSEREARPFLIEDDAGDRARVVFLAKADPVGHEFGSVGSRQPNAKIDAFLAKHGRDANALLGGRKKLRTREYLLLPGDRVYAFGPCRREAVPADYRTAAGGTPLVLEAAGDGSPEDIVELTMSPPQRLGAEANTMRWIGALMVAAGLALIVFGTQ